MNTILAIDIGSTKICAIIAEIKDDNIHVMGTGIAKSQGLKKGVVTNIEQSSRAIKTAITDAKRVAGANFSKSIVSISGAYTKSINSNGIINLPQNEIGLNEINRVMQTAIYNANIPLSEYTILHALPYKFKVDDQDFIEDPLGMNGSRLEVSTHIVTTQKSSLNNLKKAIKSAGVDVDNIVLNGYASSISVLNQDEKELGVIMIDIGGATCNLAIHYGNSIIYNDFLGVGSGHITSDLSMALHTPLHVAESIKIEYGSLIGDKDGLIELPITGDENATHEVSLEVVHNVIYARVEETLMILSKTVEKSNFKDMIGGGVVLCGGMTKLEGIRELASAVFGNLPVRIAKPKELDGLFDNLKDPSSATAIGLLLYGAGYFTNYEIDSNGKLRYKGEKPQQTISNIDMKDTTRQNQQIQTPAQSFDTGVNSINLSINKELQKETKIDGKSQKPSLFTKFWQWVTQLF
ncbi:MAG: cell division protein FtsA [Campylobacterales bacterium]|nr:cell division protein FtsA [Campylobacterales bacterium]